MQRPTCDHQSPSQQVECPGCHEQFAGDDVQELAHIDYLQNRLMEWEDDRLLPRRLAARLLEITREDRTAIRGRLTQVQREGWPVPVMPATGKLRIPGQPGLAPSLPHAAAAAAMPAVQILVHGAAYPAALSVAYPAHASPVATGIRAQVAPVRTYPLARPITPGLATRPAAPVSGYPATPSPPRPRRPAFSWKQVGTYLLSDRTLNGLLGLGVLLILAAAFVISTLNPTGLPPLARLAAMLATTAVFYMAGYLVEARLHLFRAGAALLAIGASLIPFSIWTLGQQDLLDWDHSTIWLIASALCLPVYLGSHLLLRDRIFALVSAVTGGSLGLAVLHVLGLPIEWGLCALVGLAIVYQMLARRLNDTRQPLAKALFWTAQATTPAVLLGLLAIKLFPQLWDLSLSGQVYLAGTPSASFEYAVGTAWWLGVGFYAVASRLTGRRVYAYATAWLLPCAALLTLTKAPFPAAWYDLCLAVLAAGYLLFGHFVPGAAPVTGAPAPTAAQLLRRPAFGAGLALTLLATCWPLADSASLAATLYLLCGVYWLATALLRLPLARAVARAVAVYLLPLALGVSFGAAGAITWLNLGYVALGAAYLLAGRFLLSSRRPYSYATLVREPLFQAAGLLTLLAAAWPRFVPASHDLTTFAVILTAALATVLLEQRAWAYVTVYIWFFTTGCAFVATHVLALSTGITTIHVRVTDDTQALLWACTAAAALVAAELLVRRSGESRRPLPETVVGLGAWRSRFASPLFSLCYLSTLVAIGLALSSFSTAGDVPTAPALTALTLVVAIYGLSAATRRSSVFLYAASLLATVPFVAVAGQLSAGRSGMLISAPEQARLLAVLGLCYLALGYRLDGLPGHYAKPLYLAAYLLLVGTIADAAPDTAIEVQVLGLVLLGFAWSAWLVHRDRHPAFSWLLERLLIGSDNETRGRVPVRGARALFVYITAWLLPVWLCLAGYSLAAVLHRPAPADDAYGLGLVALSIGYLALGLRIRHIRAEYRWPFYIAAYAMDTWGLALLTDQGLGAALLGYGLSAMLYGASAHIFRRSGFAWPLALTLSVAYALALAISPLGARFYGVALLPGLLAALAVAIRLRRLDAVADDAQAHRRIARSGRWLSAWASPFYLALHVGSVGVLTVVPGSATLYAASLWALVALYGVAARRIDCPRWLYLAAAIGVQAYGVSLDAALSMISGHGLTAAGLAVAGIVPAVVLLTLAELIADRDMQAAAQPGGAGRSWASRWGRPLFVVGLATVACSTLGALTLNDPQPGLLVGVAYCALGIVLANHWATYVRVAHPSRWVSAAWIALGFAAIAVQEGLRFAGVSVVEQPVGWAVGALVATCFSLWTGRTRHPLRQVPGGHPAAAPKGLWAGPLFYGSLAVGTLALLRAASNQSTTATNQTLHSLSLVVALTGLALIAHGLIRHDRRLSYGGVALLLAGYMLQLIHFGVGQPQAFVLPTGVYLLAVAFLEWRRGTAAGIKGLLELAAVALLLGTTFLQATGMLADGLNHMAYDLFLLGEGLVVVAAGAMLRWRMPFFGGGTAVVAAVVLLLADPLRAAASWYLLFLLGAALIGLVVFLEQKRQQIPLWIDDVRLRLEAWS